MKVRYRKLVRSFDAAAYQAVVDDAASTARQASLERNALFGPVLGENERNAGIHSRSEGANAGAVAAVAGLVSAPDRVDATEAEAELEEVRELLRRGDLNAQDLVNLGSGWTTIGDCIPLSDDAEPGSGGDASRAMAIVVLFVLGTLVLAPLIYWLVR